MKNTYKKGYVIKDRDMKIVNKLVKTIPLKTNGRLGYYNIRDVRGLLENSHVKITSVRKYDIYWSHGEKNVFCYEVDVEVDVRESKVTTNCIWHVKYQVEQNIRSTNTYYRDSLKLYVSDLLKYFGIETEYLVVSKIKYKYK